MNLESTLNLALRKIERLEKMVYYDHLTSVFNRRKFYQDIKRAYKNKSSYVLFIDVDHFKKWNDMYGHERGDLLLKSIAKILKDSLRGKDEVYRFGGEEFV